IPATKAVLRVASSVVDAFTRIPGPIRTLLVHLFAVGSAITALVGGIIALKAAFALGGMAASALGISFGSIVASVLPIVAVIELVAGAVYTLKYAFDHNIGGIQTLVLQAAHLIELAWNALVQLFTDG